MRIHLDSSIAGKSHCNPGGAVTAALGCHTRPAIALPAWILANTAGATILVGALAGAYGHTRRPDVTDCRLATI
jgi:hypothetical protein